MTSNIAPTSFTASPSDSPTPTDGGNSGGGSSMQRGANYFFGFLITFVILLLIFIGCGIGTRRRFAQRRALFLATLDPQWGMPKEILPPRPSLFETPFVVSDSDKSRWDNLNVCFFLYSLRVAADLTKIAVIRESGEEAEGRASEWRSIDTIRIQHAT